MEYSIKEVMVDDYAPNTQRKTTPRKNGSGIDPAFTKKEWDRIKGLEEYTARVITDYCHNDNPNQFTDYKGCTMKNKSPKPEVKSESVLNSHYANMKIQPREAMMAWLSPEQLAGFYLGSTIKYLGRFNVQSVSKGGLNDLLKARDYLNWLIELESKD